MSLIDVNTLEFQAKWEALNEYINKQIASNPNAFIFKYEREKYSKFLVFSKAKNT